MKWILSAVLLLLALYILAALALYMMQRRFIYHPTPASVHPFTEREIELPANDGQSLKVIVLNEERTDALIYFGGNAESIAGTAMAFAEQFDSHAIYLVNYRGYGGSAGSPSQSAIYSDASRVYDAVAPQHQRVSVMGRSLGSSVACWLATRREVASVILVTPFDSILRIAQSQYPIFPVSWLLKDQFPSTRFAADINVPVLVLLASDDSVIPMQSSNRLIAEFNQPVEQLTLQATGHNDIQMHDRYYAAIQKFLQ